VRGVVITVGVDFSEASLHAAAVAANLSLTCDVHEIHAIHVIQPTGMCPADDWADGATLYRAAVGRAGCELDALCASIEARFPVHALAHALTGDPCHEIIDVATEIGSKLIVLGRGAARHLVMGEVAGEIERVAPCPVVSVPTDQWPDLRKFVGHHDYILIVEDDPDVRGALVEIIEGEGYQVATCEDGRAALARLEAASELPHLIVLDFVMPQMNGWMFLSERRKDPRLVGIPVLGMSASQRLLEQRAAPEGVDEFLPKPFRAEAMLQCIQRHW